jgi:uncharacterized protein (TIGR00266 family)
MSLRPRIKLPETAKPGEIIEIKTLISHIMETGQRRDKDGRPIPRKIINTFTAENGPGEVTFAAGSPGDAAYYRLDGNALYLQRGAFMLHSEGVDVTGKWQGAKGFFSGEGLVLLKASGKGDIFFNSYGAILQVDVTDQYIVDTGYIVAFEDTLQYHVSVLPGLRAGGRLKTLFFGGEGLVCRFSGQGRLWIQTRHVSSFLSWVNPFRPTKSH